MSDKDTPNDNFSEDEHGLKLLRQKDPTETIDLNSLFTTDLTESGSFQVKGVRATSFGRLLQAVPIPTLLIDRQGKISFANRSCWSIASNYEELPGVPFHSLFPDPARSRKAAALIETVFKTRKPQVMEALLEFDDTKTWSRMHLRSLRLGRERSILLLIEDLTLEQKQLLRTKKYQQKLLEANQQLRKEIEKRKRTEEALKKARNELANKNEQLDREVAARKRAEEALKQHRGS